MSLVGCRVGLMENKATIRVSAAKSRGLQQTYAVSPNEGNSANRTEVATGSTRVPHRDENFLLAWPKTHQSLRSGHANTAGTELAVHKRGGAPYCMGHDVLSLTE
jgi:hypothetical protein